MNLDELYTYAEQHNISVDDFSMERAIAVSMPLGGDSYGIAMDSKKTETTIESKCYLAHEIGHCMTNSFYSKYSPFDIKQKHENKADRWAIKHLIPEEDLDIAVSKGYTTVWELAEYFDVTEPLMKKAICFYKNGNLADIS